MSERTRGMLKSFGVSVTTYEENMRRLVESAASRDPAKVLADALRLNAEMTARLVEMVRYIGEMQTKFIEELLAKIKSGSAGGKT